MSSHLMMGPGREFDAVRALLDQWGAAAVGIGDDGAILDVPAGSRLVVSTDSTVEDVHFRRAWLTPQELGWRAATAALSDLAAMGATPLGVLLAMTVPASWRDAMGAIASGIADATSAARAPIVGGDVSAGERLSLGITVLGYAARPLTRSGARAGDTLYVTGRLGGPAAALAAWERGVVPHALDRARFAHPEARITAGEWFAAHGATAAIDLSDGLAGDAAHLAAASGVRCVLDLDRVPALAPRTVEDALVSGEEYELLVSAPAGALDPVAFSAAMGGLDLTAIGRVEEAAGRGRGEEAAGGRGARDGAVDRAAGEVVAERGGKTVPLPGAHDHFAGT